MVGNKMDALESFRKQLEGADVDLLREMVKVFAEELMGAEADVLCGAPWGERSPERENRRNGYRERAWDTRAGTIELAVPKLREGTYFPDWLLEPRRRAERAFVSVVAECYVRGLHPSGRGPGQDPGNRAPVQVPGLRDGKGARRGGGGLPQPSAG